MKTITVRNIDPVLEDALAQRARKLGASVNKTVVSILRETLGLDQPLRKQRKTDLDDLAGTWTEDDLIQFNEVTRTFSEVDQDLWS